MSETLNQRQLKALDECPALYRATLERAFAGKSKVAGIRGFCLTCVGFLRKEITNCSAQGCPLWPFRPYQGKESAENEPESE